MELYAQSCSQTLASRMILPVRAIEECTEGFDSSAFRTLPDTFAMYHSAGRSRSDAGVRVRADRGIVMSDLDAANRDTALDCQVLQPMDARTCWSGPQWADSEF